MLSSKKINVIPKKKNAKKYATYLSFVKMRLELRIPYELHHYTDLNALIGIVNKKEIRFTNVEYLNDITEFHEGKKYFIELLEKKESKFKSKKRYKKIINYIEEERGEKNGKPYVKPDAFFSFSLSEEKDSLEQWRAYSNNENGIMITFNYIFSHLRELGISCLKVIYNDDDYCKELNDIIEGMINWDLDFDDFNLFYFWGDLHDYLAKLFLKKKNPAYENEKEWRLIYTHREIDDLEKNEKDAVKEKIRFRAANDYLVPYSILDLRKLKFFDESNFIRKVLISPTNKNKEKNKNRSLNGIRRLLEENKLSNFEHLVNFSSLPYR